MEKKNISSIVKLWRLFDRKEKKAIAVLLVPVVFTAILDIVGIAFVMPFMALIIQPNLVLEHDKVRFLYLFFHFSNTHTFLIFLGIAVFLMLLIGNAFSALTLAIMLRVGNMQRYTLANKLLTSYLQRPYSYFLTKNSSALTKNLLQEVERVIGGFLVPSILAFSKVIAILFILILLLYVNPVVAVSIFLVMGGIYAAIFISLRQKLHRIGKRLSSESELLHKAAFECFGGIKEIKLYQNEQFFLDNFSKPSYTIASDVTQSNILTQLPKFALETVAFGGIILLAVVLLILNSNGSSIIPLLSLYAFAGYRLMPALQTVFTSFAAARVNLPSIDILYSDIVEHKKEVNFLTEKEVSRIDFNQYIEMKDIYFKYASASSNVLNGISLKIKKNNIVGFAGSTGAGKTTFVDIILGLLTPTSGNIVIDGLTIDESNLSKWQEMLAYVPQHIFISDDTVINNIAFGRGIDHINFAAIENAAKAASLHDFIVNELPEGYNTQLGERGIRLSGGQRQRIGIARALYNNPEVIILDEATSALDGITEETIMDTVHHLNSKTVIIIAHRLSTLMRCDNIYLFEEGRVLAEGKYEQLIEDSPLFQQMAKITKKEVLID